MVASAELAARKGLTLVAGTQARRMTHRAEMMKRLHDGAIGEIVSGQCVRSGGAMREGVPLNEGKRIAESLLTAVMTRMSAYTGRALSWKFASEGSVLDLSPPAYVFGDLPLTRVPVPGKTPLI